MQSQKENNLGCKINLKVYGLRKSFFEEKISKSFPKILRTDR